MNLNIQKFFCYIIVILYLLTDIQEVNAQFYNGSNMSFGQNRIQHSKREWSYYRTELADIYYYPQSKELALFTVQEIPNIVQEMEAQIGINLKNKAQIIIYARHSDFHQSNIGLEVEDFYNVGGVSMVYANKIFIYYGGNIKEFRDNLRNGVARLLINNYLIGNTLSSNIASSYVASYPSWFVDGLSYYYSHEFDAKVAAEVKDGILSKTYQHFYQLPIANQKIAGMSWWHFIDKVYGEEQLNAILYYTSVTRNYEKACQFVLGKSVKELLKEWINYYQKLYFLNGEESIDTELQIITKRKKNTQYLHPKINEDGTTLAFLTNKEGLVKIYLQDVLSNKKRKIYKYHYKLEDNPDYSFPLFAWAPNNCLYIMEEYHDKVYLRPYFVDEKKFGERNILFINKITDLNFSPNGKYIAISGVNNGQSDIYIYSLAARSLEQITNDKADDYAPCFVNNEQIIFSSNRSNDTLGLDKNYNFNKFDLFLYNYALKEKTLSRLTHTQFDSEYGTTLVDKDIVSFLSENQDKNIRYIGKFQNEISRIDTSIHYAYKVKYYPIEYNNKIVKEQSFDNHNKTLYEQLFAKGQWLINQRTNFDFSNTSALNLTIEESNIDANIAKDTTIDTTTKAETKHIKRLRQMRMSDLIQIPSDSLENDSNYNIENENNKNNLDIVPRNYYVQYYINKLVTQVDFSFLNTSYQQFTSASNPIYFNPGLNALTMVELNDIMEDYRIVGGARLSAINLKDMELLFSYENLKNRLDHQTILHFQSQQNVSDNTIVHQQNIALYYIMKYPLNKVHSLRFTTDLRYNRQDWKAIDDYSLQKKPTNSIWIGLKGEYIIDFSRKIEQNIRKGFRSKLFAEISCVPTKKTKYMSNIGFDMRNYTPIFPTLIWANRLAGATSLGNNRLIYYMGGVDNWIFAKFDQSTPIDTKVNYAYQTLATNMRGFSQNIRNGSNFIVFSTELRWQIFQCIANRPLRNNFIRTFQLIGFFDAGTAWEGKSPYDKNNAFYIRTISSGSNLNITIHRQIDPIAYGCGLGIRFTLFSYFIRLDYAWGIENGEISNRQFYLSFNLDF